MPMKPSLLVTLPFVLSIAVPGLIGLTTTQAAHPQTSLISGSYQRAYETAFTGNMPLRQGARAAYTALTLALFGQAGPEVVLGDAGWLYTIEEFREPSDVYPFVETLQDVRHRLAAAGITLIPVLVPDKARVYADRLPQSRGLAIDARYDRALDALAEIGFAPIDLNTALRAGRAQGATFMRTDTHWSPAGARIAAEAIADGAGLRQAGSTVFETRLAATAPFDGDLQPFVDTGPFAPWIGIAGETLAPPTTVAATSDLGLFGDVEIDIVLVGTSFSARTEFNFPGYLQAATGLNLVSLATEGQGPFAPMQDALDRGAITDLSPSLVIWEIPERYIHTRTLP